VRREQGLVDVKRKLADDRLFEPIQNRSDLVRKLKFGGGTCQQSNSLGQDEQRLNFTETSQRDSKEVPELGSTLPAVAFSNVRRDRNNRTPYLACNSKPLVHGEDRGKSVNGFGQIHRLLPSDEVLKAACLHRHSLARIRAFLQVRSALPRFTHNSITLPDHCALISAP